MSRLDEQHRGIERDDIDTAHLLGDHDYPTGERRSAETGQRS